MWKGKPLGAVPPAGQLVLTQQDGDQQDGCWDTAVCLSRCLGLIAQLSPSESFPATHGFCAQRRAAAQ